MLKGNDNFFYLFLVGFIVEFFFLKNDKNLLYFQEN